MIYGYARCSTTELKQGVEGQTRLLKEMGAKEIYYEYESGTKVDRPELAKILSRIMEGDSLISTEVSRITRSTKQLCEIIDFAVEKRIKLVIGTLIFDCSADEPLSEAMIKMAGVFAELERKMTIRRIKVGLANAKAKGVRLGRPRITAGDVPNKVIEYFEFYIENKLTKVDYARLCGVSIPTIYKYIRLLSEAKPGIK